MGRPSKYTYSRIKRILKHIRNGGTKRGACGAAGIDQGTIKDWEDSKPDFSHAVKRAQAHGLKSDLSRLDEHVRKGNLTALLARLKMIHGLSDRTVVEQTGTVNHKHEHKGKIETVSEKLTAEEKNRIRATLVPRLSEN